LNTIFIYLLEKHKYLVTSLTPPTSSSSSPDTYEDTFLPAKDAQINQLTNQNNFFTPVNTKNNRKSIIETSAREEIAAVSKPQKTSTEFAVESNKKSQLDATESNRDLVDNHQTNYAQLSPISQLSHPPLDEIKTKSKSKKYPDGIIKHTLNSFGQNFKAFSKSKENKESPNNSNNNEDNDYLIPSSNLLNTPLSISSASPSPLSSTSASSSASSASTNPANSRELINTPKSKTLPFPYKPVAYQFTDNNNNDQNIALSKQSIPNYNLPKTPPPQDEEIPIQKTRKSFKKLVQKLVDSDILSIKNANSEIPDSDYKKSGSSSSTCTTPTSGHSTTTGTIKTSPKLGRNLFHSKETINSFDMDYNVNNSNNNTLNNQKNGTNEKRKQTSDVETSAIAQNQTGIIPVEEQTDSLKQDFKKKKLR